MDGTVRDAKREDGRPALCATAPGTFTGATGAATGGAGGGIGLLGALVVKAAGAFNGGLDAAMGTDRAGLVGTVLALTGVLLLAGPALATTFMLFAAARLAGATGFAADLAKGFVTVLVGFLAGTLTAALTGFLMADLAAGLAGLPDLATGLLAALPVPDFGFATGFTSFLAFTELLFTIDS